MLRQRRPSYTNLILRTMSTCSHCDRCTYTASFPGRHVTSATQPYYSEPHYSVPGVPLIRECRN